MQPPPHHISASRLCSDVRTRRRAQSESRTGDLRPQRIKAGRLGLRRTEHRSEKREDVCQCSDAENKRLQQLQFQPQRPCSYEAVVREQALCRCYSRLLDAVVSVVVEQVST